MKQSKDKEQTLKRGIHILFSYLRHFRGVVFVTAILAVIQAIANGAAPYLMGRLFDAILVTDEFYTIVGFTMESWIFFIIVLSVLWLGAGIIGWIVDRNRRTVGTDIEAFYPAQAASRLLRLSVSFFKSERMGEIIERIQRARNSINVIVGQLAIGIAPEILSVIIGLTFAFLIQPILAGVLLFGVIAYVIILLHIIRPMIELQKEGNKQWRESFGLSIDAIENYQAVKQATAEEYENKRISDKYINGAAKAWKKVEYIWSGIDFYQRIIVIFTQVTIILLSVYFIRTGQLSIGGLIALNAYAGMLFGPFMRLGYNWQTIQTGLVNIMSAEEMFEHESERTHESGGKRIQKIRGDVSFEGVHFSYPDDSDSRVLNNVSFEVSSGEVVALVGESGVGKSTTIELLSGYYYPTKGKIFVDDNDIKDLDLTSLRKNIAVVSQEPVLFNDTVEMNIKYGSFNARKTEVEKAAKEAHADIFIDKFPTKYKQVVGERGIKLSVGQKQRIAIARAILRNPKILILDEPTSALDSKTEQYISESLEKLMKGRTTFIIAHRLSTVRRADKILVFDKGKIVEEGKHDELLKIENGVYRRLYEYQIGLHR